VALYLLVNVGLLRVLPLNVLAASNLPAAEAARIILPHGGSEIVTVISILVVLSLLNTNLLMAPRVLFSIGRDGLFTEKATVVSKGGTPRVALALTSVFAVAIILSGSFEQIIALFAVLLLLYYVSAFLAVFVLRHRAPTVQRPYKALGYPLTTAIVFLGSLAFLVAAIAEDPRSGLIAVIFLACCAPAYVWMARVRRLRVVRQLA
jgi:APA family basic amino acid/polyamine antiporter